MSKYKKDSNEWVAANKWSTTTNKKYQKGGNLFNTNKVAYVDSVLTANKDKEWVQRLYQKKTPSIQIPGVEGKSTHYMSDNGQGYVYPTVVNKDNGLEYIGDNAEDYARETNTGIQLPPEKGS